MGADGNLYTTAIDSFAVDGQPVYLGRIMRFSLDGQYQRDYVSMDDYVSIITNGPKDLDFGPDRNLYTARSGGGKIVIFGARGGPQSGQHIGTLMAPHGVTFNGASSTEFI
jgi:hypothetical protein